MPFPYTFPFTFHAVSEVTANTFCVLCPIVAPDSYSSDNEDSSFPLANAFEYAKPNKRYHSNDTTVTTISLTYFTAIDSIFFCNINFTSLTVTQQGNNHSITAVQDKDTGLYHAFVRFDSANSVYLTVSIPNQSTTNSEAFFAIGSILAGARIDFTAYPQYALRKTLIENIFEKRFDGQNREVQEIGRPYHEVEYNWNAINDTNFDQLEDIVRIMGQDGIGVLFEKRTDYEASYLCQLLGNFPHSRIMLDRHKAPLKFRELV